MAKPPVDWDSIFAGSEIGPFDADAVRREAIRRAAAGGYAGPSGRTFQMRPVQGTSGNPGQSLSTELRTPWDPMILHGLQQAAPQAAGMVQATELIDNAYGTPYRRHLTLYPEDAHLPIGQLNARIKAMAGKTYVPKPGEFGESKYPSRMSYSDYASGKYDNPEFADSRNNEFGTTALGGTQGGSKSTRSTSSSRQSSTVSNSGKVVAPPLTNNTSSNKNTTSTSQSSSRPQASSSTSSAQGVKGTSASASPTNKQGSSQRQESNVSTSTPSESSTSKPVAQAEPSGEALTYFRKNKASAGWDALGTAVSLVQQSLKPEKGGLKSRAEYDRLLRGSDNFKKLDGDEQQRVRQAFAQWMNEQTIFKGKA